MNGKKVRRLMRGHGLQPRRRTRFVATTDSTHNLPVFPNLARDMEPDGPNQLWVADITYVAVVSAFDPPFPGSLLVATPQRPPTEP